MTDSTDDFMVAEDYSLAPLEDDCKLLGSLLDDCLLNEVGEDLFKKLEKIRSIAHCAAQLSKHDTEASRHLSQRMAEELMNMNIDEALPLTRALGHYLSLTSIAELHHRMRQSRTEAKNPKACDEMFDQLINSEGIPVEELFNSVANQTVEIVLTAHPTQVNRRTLQYKHTKIAALLQQKDRPDLTSEERTGVMEDLLREITALWQTDELRRKKPTPIDEARGGLHIVEQSLWAALPAFVRRLSGALKKHTGRELPLHATPIKMGSWMGGDRDGNPNVDAKVTTHVVALGKWMAADLYLREVDALRFELSMSACSDQVWHMALEIMHINNQKEEAKEVKQRKGARVNFVRAAPQNETRSSDGMLLGGVRPTESAQIEFQMPEAMPSVPHDMPGQDPEGGSEVEFPMSPNLETGTGQLDCFDLPSSPEESITPQKGSSLQDLQTLRDSLAAEKWGATPGGLRAPDLSPMADEAELSARKHSFRVVRPTTEVLKEAAAHEHSGMHPYRIILGEVRRKLMNTRRRMEAMLHSPNVAASAATDDEDEWYQTEEQLAQPLLAIYWSLWECGAGIIAEGRLLDLIRRVYAFGMALLKLDLRQDSARHTEAMDAITTYLGYGTYSEWSEDKRLEWLTEELSTRRPLVPANVPMSEDVKEVLETFRVAARLGTGSLGAYVISMTTSASDVLAVELLQKEARVQVAGEMGTVLDHSNSLRVVPLFETLGDLDNAADVMIRLFENPWYKQSLQSTHGNHQEVMLGYSDSGKDAGRLAANWALYRCQEKLVAITNKYGIKLTLFHGRGGSVGRGGGPTYLAIQSQAPGSVMGSFRITEQGEMVQAKFGIAAVAQNQLEIYTTAVLQSTLRPPSPPKCDDWRELMDFLGKASCDSYRGIVFEHPKFISYFTHATPESELGNLNIGSRPARRKQGTSVRNLRAIPWIFAWTQTRLVLPSWLGVGEALTRALAQGHKAQLRQMYQEWPFFQATIDLIEMILAKTDMRIAALYEEVLVEDPQEKALGKELRQKCVQTQQAILEVTGKRRLLANNAPLRRMLEMRNPYIDPINILQVEVLRRLRQTPDHQRLRDVLLISINGIAAGMRNTG